MDDRNKQRALSDHFCTGIRFATLIISISFLTPPSKFLCQKSSKCHKILGKLRQCKGWLARSDLIYNLPSTPAPASPHQQSQLLFMNPQPFRPEQEYGGVSIPPPPTAGNASSANLSHLTRGHLFSPFMDSLHPTDSRPVFSEAPLTTSRSSAGAISSATLPATQSCDSTNEMPDNVKAVFWLTKNKIPQKDVERNLLSQNTSSSAQALEPCTFSSGETATVNATNYVSEGLLEASSRAIHPFLGYPRTTGRKQ